MRKHQRGGRIPNRLRQYRKAAGFTQKEVAKLIGHQTNGQLSRWEHGVSHPSVGNLLKLSWLYHRVINDLYLDLYWDAREEMVRRLSELRMAPPQ